MGAGLYLPYGYPIRKLETERGWQGLGHGSRGSCDCWMNPCTCARANVSSVSQAGLDEASPAIIFCIGPWFLFVAGNSPGGDGLTRDGVTAFRLIQHFQTIARAFSNYCFCYCSGIPAYSPQGGMIILEARLIDVNYIGCNCRPSSLSFRLLDWHFYKFLKPPQWIFHTLGFLIKPSNLFLTVSISSWWVTRKARSP
jgi:hypothetical protein